MPQSLDRTRKAFQLNLEQQRKRAKDLCRAARRGDPAALARVAKCLAGAGKAAPADAQAFKLADAQWVIARELGLGGWARLKEHIAAMERERAAIGGHEAPDHGPKTLHIRCGGDIAEALRQAGFTGDYLEYANPFCQGPVTGEPDDPERLLERARFLAQSYGNHLGITFSQCETRLRREEDRLAAAPRDYERVVLWFEHDSFDQLILIRCLSLFAAHRPPLLDLVSANRFPGSRRFLGLGQLPPEGLRLLWAGRNPVSAQQTALGQKAWKALQSPDPTGLAALADERSGLLPDLSPALRRHLRELPSVRNGLSLTEELVLASLARGGETIGDIFHGLLTDREPLPWLGDIMFLYIVEAMGKALRPPYAISPETASEPWQRRFLTITPVGEQVLSGERDWLTLMPPERWVGGVRIAPGAGAWRWDEDKNRPVFVRQPTPASPSPHL
ncbi:conserved hypothetical protein [Solidesulfovibrio fructosivorans JJ]]|uniref:DUF1835 domain-containing protein n=1 Tax=Solidesulfovibrio fructosivorans JJ] TaxID=596151 RepID=E1K1J9_SOLFR|nr:DUF1835 domain-containing protein [Solidesulfovibrio fructosivorans]EFL49493.1 conserved hypothetical protein [Solidesulfovibrio fructosivorans JJ]]